MFCNKCGTQLPDGTPFCSSCGANLNASVNPAQAPMMDYQAQMQMQQMQAQQYQMQKNSIRQSEIALLQNVYDHFNLKRATFQEYDKVGERLSYYQRGARSALIVWGAIITVISFMIASMVGSSSGAFAVFLVFSFLGAGMIAGGVMMKVNNKKKLRLYESEYIRLSEELNAHYNAYPMCPVGAQYSNPEIIEVIMDVMQSGRANTIADAINILVSDINQSEMQAYLQSIENYSRQTAAASKTAAVFAAASFFK